VREGGGRPRNVERGKIVARAVKRIFPLVPEKKKNEGSQKKVGGKTGVGE